MGTRDDFQNTTTLPYLGTQAKSIDKVDTKYTLPLNKNTIEMSKVRTVNIEYK